jgi:hypothetical protein
VLGGVFEFCGIFVFLSFSLPFWLGLPLFMTFIGFAAFPSSR